MRFFKTVCFLSFLALILAPMVGLRASETVDQENPGEICKAYGLAYKDVALKRDQGVKAQDLIAYIGNLAGRGEISGPQTANLLRMVIDVYSQPELTPQDFYEAAHKECSTHFGLVQS